VLLDNLIDRGIDRRLVGNVHFKDLQRMSFGFCRFEELAPDPGISSFDVSHGRNHRMTPPCEFQYREFPKTTARAGHNNDFSAHLKSFL
jgi:hypothetical protein